MCVRKVIIFDGNKIFDNLIPGVLIPGIKIYGVKIPWVKIPLALIPGILIPGILIPEVLILLSKKTPLGLKCRDQKALSFECSHPKWSKLWTT